jgi:hypothetical protein
MIIQQIVHGFVVQQYDTEKNRFIGQEFIAEQHSDWENKDDEEPLEDTDDRIPSTPLPLLMIQPKQEPLNITKLILGVENYSVGEWVSVTPLNNGDSPTEQFDGTVVGINGTYIQVKDQEDNVFDCEVGQVLRLDDED